MVESHVTPRLLLLHTLALAVINEWSLVAGYPGWALRERLYVDDGMAGMLIYTATSDSAGSLGGIVAQGEPDKLAHTLRSALARADWLGATWPPTLVARELWHRVGGYSVEFSPGMGSDNDFSMKLWHAGCRVFLGVGDSLVYHFSETSTRSIRKTDGRRQFLRKWGLGHSTVDRYYLRRGESAGADPVLADPEPSWGLRWQALRGALKRRFG